MAWYRFRSGGLARRLAGYGAMVVILAVLGGASMASVAGSRRTASAYDRFLEKSDASVLSFNAGGYEPDVDEAVRRLPGVAETATYVGINVAEVDEAGQVVEDRPQNAEALGSVDGRYFRQDRPVVLQGRMPDPGRPDEVLVNEAMYADFGLSIGDRIELGVFTDEQLESFGDGPPPEPVGRGAVTVTGVGLFGDEVVQSDSEKYGRMLLTPAFTGIHIDAAAYGWQGVRLDPGHDIGEVREQIRGLLTSDYAPNFRESSVDRQRARRVTRPLVLALAVFGLLAGVATIVLVSQSVLRSIRSDEGDLAVLRAVGAGPASLAVTAAIGPILAIGAGSAAAIAVALALSPLAPFGALRKIEPTSGFDADWLVIGGGVVAAVAVLLVVTAIGSILQVRRGSRRAVAGGRTPSSVSSLPSRLGMPIWVVTGARSALGGGARTGQQTLTRSTMLGAVIAVGALSASLGFAGSLRSLVDSPRLYGWDWDVAFIAGAGYSSMDLEATREVLDNDPGVLEWAPMWFGGAALNGRNVPLLGVDPSNSVTPPIVSGRKVESSGEVVLGATTIDDLGVALGDSVVLDGDPVRPLTVVGVASFPAIGAYQSAQTSLGVGAMVDAANLPSLQLATAEGYSGANAAVVRLNPAVAQQETTPRLADALRNVAEVEDAVAMVGVQRPAEIVDNQSMGLAPALLAVVVAGAVLVSLGLALTSSVRHRRGELAMLRALGFTGGELGGTVSTQASLVALVGIAVGLPIGIALGRWLWLLFARELAVVPSPTVSIPALAGLVIGVLVLSNVAAFIPAGLARCTRTAEVLSRRS